MKHKKTYLSFKNSLREKYIDPSYYYNDFEKICYKCNQKKQFLNKLGFIRTKKEFIKKLNKVCKDNPQNIQFIPSLVAIRNDKLNGFIALDQQNHFVNYFSENTISIEKAIAFLQETGFFEALEKMTPIHLKSYYLGLEVGMDTNGRKNRGGKQIDKMVRNYIQKYFKSEEFVYNLGIEKISNYFHVQVPENDFGKKRFHFAIKNKEMIWIINTHFYNAYGSKCSISNDFVNTQNKIHKIDRKTTNYKWNLLTIIDGKGLLNNEKEFRDIFYKMDFLYNIDDLEKNLFQKLKQNNLN